MPRLPTASATRRPAHSKPASAVSSLAAMAAVSSGILRLGSLASTRKCDGHVMSLELSGARVKRAALGCRGGNRSGLSRLLEPLGDAAEIALAQTGCQRRGIDGTQRLDLRQLHANLSGRRGHEPEVLFHVLQR